MRNPFVKKGTEKPPEPQYFVGLTGQPAYNYAVYYLTKKEKTMWSVICFAVAGVVGWLFYGGYGVDEYGNATQTTLIANTIAICLPGVVAMIAGLPIIAKNICSKNRKKLGGQFRDMLDSVSTSLISGANVQDSFINARNDLADQYGPDEFINKEMEILVTGIENNLHIDEVLADFGRRSDNEDILSFSNVFRIAYETGGNMRDVVQTSQQIISDKMGIGEEIETAISGAKSDSLVMIFIPIMLVAVLKFMSGGPDGLGAKLATPSGMASVTVAIICFVGAFLISNRITDIKA